MLLKYSLVFLRIAIGLFIGVTVAIIGQSIFGYNTLVFCFLLIVLFASFIRVSRKWGFILLSCFILSFVMLGYLIKLYIDVAPG